MRFDFTLGRSNDDAPRRARGPVRRVLVLSDLRGNAAEGQDRVLDRKIAKVDVDNLDAVLTHTAPAIQLATGDGTERLEIRRFDDFHPDALVETLSVFRRLRDVRTRLQHPATFAGAVADVQGETRSIVQSTDAAGWSQPSDEGEASALSRLLGGGRATATSQAAAAARPKDPGDMVEALIRQAVAPHIVPAPDPQLPQMLSAVDAAMTDLMRAVLHDPAFQQVEAAWRGVQWLVSALDLGETLELHLLHVTRDELPQAVAQGGDLWRRLVERESPAEGGRALSVLVGNYTFGPSADDIALLQQLGAMAAAMATPFIAAASPRLLGATSLALQPQPRDWSPLAEEDQMRWQALRAHAAAAHVGLAVPRLLLRLPYGQTSDPITAFKFEEQPVHPEHESFLWGNPALAYAVAVARALDEEGDPATAGTIEALPAFAYRTDDGTALQPPAEIALSDRGVEAIQARGLMPIIGFRDRTDIQLLTPRAIASSARPLFV